MPSPASVDVLLGQTKTTTIINFYNPNNRPYTWTVSGGTGSITNPSGWIVQIATNRYDWHLLGTQTIVSEITGNSKYRKQLFPVFNVYNTAPIFSAGLTYRWVYVNSTILYPFPSYSDESGHDVTVTWSPTGWITYDRPTNRMTIAPTDFAHVGSRTVTVTLSDSNLATVYTFPLDVKNRAPQYSPPYPVANYPEVKVHLNFAAEVLIPPFRDPDFSDAFVTIIDPFPSPVIWSIPPDQTKVVFQPVAFSEVGTHNAFVRLFDAGGAFSELPIKITVLNDKPIFPKLPLPVFTVPMNTSTDIKLTSFLSDKEGHTIFLTAWQYDSAMALVAPPYFLTQVGLPSLHTMFNGRC